MKRRPAARDRRGLTLIELVLTLTILAVAGALVSGALATALRSWRTGLSAGRAELVARIVLERVASQLRSAVPAPARREGADTVAFDAGDGHVRFVTLAAGATPTQVFYGVADGADGPRLVYREHPWPDKDFFGAGAARREEEVAEVTGFAVKAVKRSDASGDAAPGAGADAATGGVVAEAWSAGDRELPARVDVSIEVRAEAGAEPRVYEISVPLLAGGPQ